MSGIFYGAGVGPGDPELLTVKALRVMKQCPVIAIPVSDKNFTEAAYDPTGTDPAYKRYLEKCVAYQIAVQAGADIGQKAKLYLPMPMMKEKEQLRQVHERVQKKQQSFWKKEWMWCLSRWEIRPCTRPVCIFIKGFGNRDMRQGSYREFLLFVRQRQDWIRALWRTRKNCILSLHPMRLKKD